MNDKIINKLVWGYVIGVVVYHGLYILEIYNDPEQELSFLALNDLGDFLSGFFAPLAFVFLYLSYKQLQQQLKIANDTLDEQKKQAEEQLKIAHKTLEEQKKQVEISTYPFLYINFEIHKVSGNKEIRKYYLYNAGETIGNVKIFCKTTRDLILEIGAIEKNTRIPLTKLIEFLEKYFRESYQNDYACMHIFNIFFKTKLNYFYKQQFNVFCFYTKNGNKLFLKEFDFSEPQKIPETKL